MLKKEQAVKNFERRSISKELGMVLDEIKEKVKEYGHGCVKISDVEASNILLQKIKEAKIEWNNTWCHLV